jgi:hypothetical protein
VLNNKTILVQKVFEMLNGRVDRLVKLGEKYPNVKPSDKIKPQEIQVEIDKIRRIMKKIPIFQKHDYTKVFTRGIDPKSKEYTSLYYLGMKANDQVYKTNLCSKDKQCMKVIDRLNDVSKKRGDIIKNVVEQYNARINMKEKFDFGVADTQATGNKNSCYWYNASSYGNFCGPTENVNDQFEKTGGPCDAVDSCCYEHDIAYGKCKKEGDWCLNSPVEVLSGLGLCTSSPCVALADIQVCQCEISTLSSSLDKIESWSGIAFTLLSMSMFCTYRYSISAYILTAVLYIVVNIVLLIVDVSKWLWDLLIDLAEWFGDEWNDFWDWCKSWLPTSKNPDYIQNSGSDTDTESSVNGLIVAIVSEEGTPVEQVTRVTDEHDKLFNTDPDRQCSRSKCGDCCFTSITSNDNLRLKCCLDDQQKEYKKFKPNMKPLPKPKIPLKPPSGGIVPGISPVITRYCDKNNEVLIQENGRRTTLRGDNLCCTTECIEDTWHKKCGTNEVDFSTVSSRLPNEVWSNSYLSDENLGMSCNQPQPCFMRDGRMYECGNQPTSGGSGGGGGDGSDYGTVRPNFP